MLEVALSDETLIEKPFLKSIIKDDWKLRMKYELESTYQNEFSSAVVAFGTSLDGDHHSLNSV